MSKQKTLKGSFSLFGKGLHTGLSLTVTFNPAPENTGLRIQRIDLEDQPTITAIAEHVVETQRGTVLAENDVRVSTVEHGMAALYAMGVDNCLIQVNGPEFPILDGSAEMYVQKIQEVGLVEQNAQKDYYIIRHKIEVKDDTGSCITILPDDEFSLTAMCSFDSKFINSQFASLDKMEDFPTEIAPARTFVFVRDIEPLLQANLIKGGDLDNAIVIYERETSQELLDQLADQLKALFCLTSSQIGASGAVINALIPTIPLNVCLLLAGFVTIFYTTFGGMIADQVSDLIQFGIILVGLAIATPIVLKHAGGWAAISAALPGEKLNMTQIGWASIIGYFFNYFCTFLCGPEMVSRFETCKDEKTAVRASFLCAILMAAMAVFPTLLGLAAFALKDQLPGLAENGSNAMMIVTGTYAPGIVTGLISAAIICATMSSADSNLLCMSTMIINDIYPGFGGKKKLNDKQTIFYTRACNVVAALVAMGISMFGVSLVAMNTFAFGIRCAGPFAAYGLGLAVPKATKNSGLISIFTGTIAFVVWQLLSNGGTLWFMMPVVFGSLVSVITFYVVNLIEWKRGVPAAPSAYVAEEAK